MIWRIKKATCFIKELLSTVSKRVVFYPVLRNCKKPMSQTFKRSAFQKALGDLNLLEDLVEKCTLTKCKISLKREKQKQSVSNQSRIIKPSTPSDIFIPTVAPNFTKSKTPSWVFSRFYIVQKIPNGAKCLK